MIPTLAHKNDNDLFAKKSVEFQAFLTENAAAPSDASIAKAVVLRDELTEIKKRIGNHVKVAGLSTDAAGFTSYIDAPGTGMKHLGTVANGHDQVNTETKGILGVGGAGIVEAKVWDAICDPDYKRFFREYLRKGERMSSDAYKLLEVGIDSQGGYLAPAQTIERVIERKPTPTRMAGMVEQMIVGRDSVELPRVNYQGTAANGDDPTGMIYSTGFRVANTEETPPVNGLPNVTDANLFGKARVDNFTHMIMGALTNNQIEDPAIDVLGWVESKFDQTIEIFRDALIFNGTGIQQALGIIPYALGGNGSNVVLPALTSAVANQITGDDTLNIALDVPEQYEENLKFIFNKTFTYKYLRTLKDSTGRYLFGAGFQDNGLANGKPTDLVGYPYVFSQLVTSKQVDTTLAGGFTSGSAPVIFGDPKGYTQTLRLGFSVQRCSELLARQNQQLLIGRVRIGGTVLEPWRLRVLKVR